MDDKGEDFRRSRRRCPRHLMAKVPCGEEVPVLPISGWKGDHLLKKSKNMEWRNGQEVAIGAKSKGEKILV